MDRLYSQQYNQQHSGHDAKMAYLIAAGIWSPSESLQELEGQSMQSRPMYLTHGLNDNPSQANWGEQSYMIDDDNGEMPLYMNGHTSRNTFNGSQKAPGWQKAIEQ